ncbi:MAG: transglutaminase-like domain-containing protein [Planctomycetota bacterium]|nr:transglutaminase-like domain-containing protein [Planctomycetota bacterium]
MSFWDEFHRFDRMLASVGEEFRVAEAALLFALDYYPDLDVNRFLKRLDHLASQVDRLGARTLDEQAKALQTVLVWEEGLKGNQEDYYDSRNSYLNEVLDRGLGIPVSLSAVWLDVTQNLGWPFHGVGVPGHFVIGGIDGEQRIWLDPFVRGRILDRAGIEMLVASAGVGEVEDLSYVLRPVTGREILFRMLANLRLVYRERREWSRFACVLGRMRAVVPESEEILLEFRGVLAGLAARG